MSSMRNAVQRRNHRERAQPQERAKWGLLEKRKDYKLRAADHKVKKRKIKALQQKASERNEDEFYFAMVNNQSRGGAKIAKRGSDNSGGSKTLSNEAVKLMKTQDVGYLRTVLQQTRRERERLEQDVVLGQVGVRVNPPDPTAKKIIFGDVMSSNANPPRNLGRDHDEDAGEWLSDDESEVASAEELDAADQPRNAAQIKRTKKLNALREREDDLAAALGEVEAQRARMNGSVGGVNKNGTKFKIRDRKR